MRTTRFAGERAESGGWGGSGQQTGARGGDMHLQRHATVGVVNRRHANIGERWRCITNGIHIGKATMCLRLESTRQSLSAAQERELESASLERQNG